MSRKKFFGLVLLGLVFLMQLGFSSKPVFATYDPDSFYNQLLVNNVKRCYSVFKNTIRFNALTEFDDLLIDNYKSGSTIFNPGQIVLLPSTKNKSENDHISETVKDSQVKSWVGARYMNCFDVFVGDESGKWLDGDSYGLFDGKDLFSEKILPFTGEDLDGDDISEDTELKSQVLEAMDYTVDKNAQIEESEVAVYKLEIDDGTGTIASYKWQIPIGEDGRVSEDDFAGNEIIEKRSTKYSVRLGTYISAGWRFTFQVIELQKSRCNYGDGEANCKLEIVVDNDNFDFKEEKNVDIQGDPFGATVKLKVSREKATVDNAADRLYKKGNYENVIKNVTGGKLTYSQFSDSERYDLYIQYLKDYFGYSGVADETCEDKKPGALVQLDGSSNRYYIYAEGQGWCRMNYDSALVEKNKGQALTVFDNSNYFLNTVIYGLDSLVRHMGSSIDYSGKFTPQNSNIEDPETEQQQTTCYDATNLSWIMCTVLEGVSGAANDFYDDNIEPNLSMDASLFSTDKEVYKVWEIFRNIANILFVIFLLVVIFSQLTGVGIDNYGIKKILPKLIVAAILVNFSYYICQILVDLSNILGVTLKDFFSSGKFTVSFGGGEGSNVILEGSYDGGGSVATWLLSTLTGVGGISIFAISVYLNPGILLSLLIAGIGILIAFLFLFVLLAGRKAAIILLVAISPLAFVCFVLPNTKDLFKKWVKFIKAMLLLFPICGLLVGAGNFGSQLMMNTVGDDNFASALSAMLVGIVPVFFVPALLKTSMSALGGLGAKISGFGDRLRGGATRGLKDSDKYKELRERGMERKNRIKGGIGKDGKARNVGKFGQFMLGGKRSMARSRAQYLKDQDARNRESSIMDAGYEAAMIGQKKKAEAEDVTNYMTLINDRTRNGEDETKLMAEYDEYLKAGNKAGAVAVARIAGRRKDTAANFLNQRVTGYGLSASDASRMREANNAHSDIFSAVAKEISTGENSQMYRSSTPLGFQFAADCNKKGKDISASDIDYEAWGSNSANIEGALDHYVTNSQELVGVKNSSLGEIVERMNDGSMDSAHVARLRQLARETIENRDKTGIWDSTKAENIYKIAGMAQPGPVVGGLTENPTEIQVRQPAGTVANNAEGQILVNNNLSSHPREQLIWDGNSKSFVPKGESGKK